MGMRRTEVVSHFMRDDDRIPSGSHGGTDAPFKVRADAEPAIN